MAEKKAKYKPSLQITEEYKPDWEAFIGSQTYRTASIMALIRVFMHQHGQQDVLKVLTSNNNLFDEEVSSMENSKENDNIGSEEKKTQEQKIVPKKGTSSVKGKPEPKQKKTISTDPWSQV